MEGIMLDENKARRVKFWVKFQDLETIPNYSDFSVCKEHWSELLDVPSDFTGGSNPAWFRLHPHPKPWDNCNCISCINCLDFLTWSVFFRCNFQTCNFKVPIDWSCQGRRGGWALNIQDAMRCVKSVLSPGLSALSPQVGWGRAWKGLDPLAFEKRDVLDWAIMSRSEKKRCKNCKKVKSNSKNWTLSQRLQHPASRTGRSLLSIQGALWTFWWVCSTVTSKWDTNAFLLRSLCFSLRIFFLFASVVFRLQWVSMFSHAFALFSSSFRFPALPWLLFHPALLPETRTARRILKAGGCRVSRGGFSRQWKQTFVGNCFVDSS